MSVKRLDSNFINFIYCLNPDVTSWVICNIICLSPSVQFSDTSGGSPLGDPELQGLRGVADKVLCRSSRELSVRLTMAGVKGHTPSLACSKRKNKPRVARARNPKTKVARVSTSSSLKHVEEEEEEEDIQLALQLKIEQAKKMAKENCKFSDVSGATHISNVSVANSLTHLTLIVFLAMGGVEGDWVGAHAQY